MEHHRTRINLQAVYRVAELADLTVPFALRVVADLRVADQLTDGPRTVEELAAATQTHAPSLHLALRALACKGIFSEVEPGRFGLTPMAELLTSDHPLLLREGLSVVKSDLMAWSAVEHSLRTGEPAFDHVHGRPYWEYMADHPEDNERFNLSQEVMTRLELLTVPRSYNWTDAKSVVDIGGGNGAFLAGLLSRFKRMRGVLVDLPHVVEGAQRVLEKAGVADRCEVIPGGYLESVPHGHDVYLLKRVLWGISDARARKLLRAIRGAMRTDSRLLILEPPRQPGDAFDVAKISDLRLLVLGGHGSRTREELDALFADTDLTLTNQFSARFLSIVEARARAALAAA